MPMPQFMIFEKYFFSGRFSFFIEGNVGVIGKRGGVDTLEVVFHLKTFISHQSHPSFLEGL